MKCQLILVFMIGLLFISLSTDFAKGQDHRLGLGWVLEIYGVSEELEVTESQKDALRDHSELFIDSFQRAISKLKSKLNVAARDLTDFQKSRPKTREKEELRKFIEELNQREKKFKSIQEQIKSEVSSAVQKVLVDERKDLEKVLLSRQMKRLEQLQLQLLGLNAILAPRVIKELKVSDSQQKEIRKAIAKHRPKINRQKQKVAVVDSKDKAKRKGEKDKLDELLETAERELMDVLKVSQRSKFKKLLGKKFDFAAAAKPAKK